VSRQGIIAVTAMGVGLLTFCFVIGVQVGKKSLTQKNYRAKTIDDEINELPEPLDVQLQIFESIESNPTSARNAATRPTSNVPETVPPPPAAAPSAPAAADTASRQQPNAAAALPPPSPAANAPQPNAVGNTGNTATTNTAPPNTAPATAIRGNEGERWTVQIAALSSVDGANRLSEQLKSQGFPAKIVISGGLHKVQLDWSGSRADANSRISRLQIRGHGDATAVRVQ
jgi:cell division septation protein DedD